MCQCCKPLLKAIDAYLQKADDDLTDALKSEGYVKPKKTVKAINDMEDDVADALTRETDYFKAALEASTSAAAFMTVWPELKVNDTLKAELETIFKQRFTEAVTEFANGYLSGLDKGLQILRVSKRTVSWIEEWSVGLADLMQLNSHQMIETVLASGLERGAGIAEITRNIMDYGIRDEYYRARRTAITEVLTAHRAAQQEAMMQSPATKEKAWKHTGTFIRAPRQNHIEMDGQRVPKASCYTLIGADGETYMPLFPGDPILPAAERIECHCLSQGIADESVLGLTLEERKTLQQQAIDEMDADWETQAEARNKAMVGYTEKRLTNPAAQGIIKYSPDQPRDEHGRWVSGGASPSGTATSGASSTGYTRPALQLPKAEYAKVMSEISTHYYTRFEGKQRAVIYIGQKKYLFEVAGFGNYNIYGMEKNQ